MTGRVWVNERAAREVRRGSLHIYAQNVEKVEADDGEWVEVVHGTQTLGYGFYSKTSSIPVKLYSLEEGDPEEVIFGRLEILFRRKKRLYGSVFRLAHAEGDLLPGLVIDVYDNVAALRTSVKGLETYIEGIADVIAGLGIDNVVERNDSSSRTREGLPIRKRLLRGKEHTTIIEEGSVKFFVDVLKGQKTGFYLDQRDNRILSEKFSDVRKVLDVYSYTGGFGIHLGKDGAEVIFVELGREASEMLAENLRINSVSGKIVRGDAVDVMKKLINRGERFDVVSLDPPALVKGNKLTDAARKSYFLINRLAIRLLRPGGVLLTSSCTQPLTPREFLGIVRGAAEKEGRRIELLGSVKGQALDHTYYPPHPETHYLKHIVAVVE